MKFCKKTLSFILAFVLLFSSITPVSAKNDTAPKKTTIKGQEVIIGDTAYYVFSTDKNAKSDLIKAHEKGKLQLEKLQGADGLEISGELNGASVGAGETEKAISYYLNIKGSNFIGVGGKSFDWGTLPDGLELQVWYLNEDGIDVNIGSPITINESNYQRTITMTVDIAGQPLAFGLKTNVDSETYLTDVYYTNENSPEPSTTASNDMTFDLVQVPSTNLSVKWVDVNRQQLARENTPATVLKDILTFNFIENRKFDLPNQDRDELYFRLINKVKRVEVKDMQGATALVSGKKDGEEVTLDGKIYKLTTSYDPAFNKGSKIQLMYMPDVIDRTKNPETPTPDKYLRVTIDAGEGAKLAQGESKKVYDVRVGKSLKAEHYPKLEISDKAKYKEPIAWTIAPGTAITKAENIKGNAAKTAAETITAANLAPKDIIVLQGYDMTEKDWHTGVKLADNVDADKKAAFEALLKEATVTDLGKDGTKADPKQARTTANAGTFEGTLLVTFKDGSTLEVEKQKLIVKPNTVKVSFDNKANDDANAPRHKETVVKGKVSSTSGYPVKGAVVEIKDEEGKVIGITKVTDDEGNFTAGTRELKAGEKLTASVTLPDSKLAAESTPKTVKLNADRLKDLLPIAKAQKDNFSKKQNAIIKEKLDKLNTAITTADPLVDANGKATATDTAENQTAIDNAVKALEEALKALTANIPPTISGPKTHEIYKGQDLDLKALVDVTDGDGANDLVVENGSNVKVEVKKVDGQTETPVADLTTIKETVGTYKVTYTAEDKAGAKVTHEMTLTVKERTTSAIEVTTDPATMKYLIKEKNGKAQLDLTGMTLKLVDNLGDKTNVQLTDPKVKLKVNGREVTNGADLTLDDDVKFIEVEYTPEGSQTPLKAQTKGVLRVGPDYDKDGTDDRKQGFDPEKIEKLEVIKQPQLDYIAKDVEEGKTKFKLNLEGMIVRMTDKAGKEKLAVVKNDGKFYDYDEKDKEDAKEITQLTATPVHGATLTPETSDTAKGDNGSKVAITGPNNSKAETDALKVFYDANKDGTPDHKEGQKTPAPSAMARNVGENPQGTTVEGMATPGAVIKITDKEGKVLTTEPEKVVAGPDGKYKATISPKLDDGTEIKVTAKLGEMGESDKTPAKVFDDKNDNKQPDKDEGFNIAKATDIKFVDQPDLTYLVPTKDKEVTFDGKDGKGKAIYLELSYKNGKKTESKIMTLEELIKDKEHIEVTPKNGTTDKKENQTHDLVGKAIEVKLKKVDPETATSKATSTSKFDIKLDANNNGIEDEKEKFDIAKTTKVTIIQDPSKMNYLVTTKDGKTPFETAGVVIKLEDASGKTVTYNAEELKKLTDKITLSPAEGEQLGLDNGKTKTTPFTVTITGAEGTDKPTATGGNVKVQLDADGNKIADEDEKSEQAKDVKALNQNKVDPQTNKVTKEEKDTTTVTGKAKPGSTVIIKNEAGDQIGKVDKVPASGEFTAEVTKQNVGDKVKVVVKEPGKQDSDPVEKTVVRDSDNDGEDDSKAGQTERPAAIASNKGKTPTFTTIEGKTEKGATITVNVKVNGEEKPVTVENLKVNDDGTYTLEAKYDKKPLENGAEILVYAENAPKTISKPQTTTVFNDFNKDGKPDGGKVDLTDVKDIQVIAPKKMSYTQGDKLDGTGLKAVVRDNKGGIEIFDYDNEKGTFKDADGKEVADIKATVANKPIKDLALTEKDHDGKAIDVKVGTIPGSTNQKLEVKQLQTPTPTIVFAANQNTVGSDGSTPTQTAKQKTIVKFTVKNKPTTVYVRYTVQGETKPREESFEIGANDDATKTVDLNVKLPVGAEVQVLAKDPDKTLSEAAKAKVVRDANNDGTADNKTKLKDPIIDNIKAGDDKILVTPPDGATELVITETDNNGDTPQGSTPITVKKDTNGNWKIGDTQVKEEGDKLIIPKGTFKLDEYNVVKVDAKGDPDTTEPSTKTKTVGKAADTDAPSKPKVDQAVQDDTDVRVKTPVEQDAKTITVEITKPGKTPTKVIVEKDGDKWKTSDGKEVPEENGKLVVPVTPKLEKDDTVKVTVTDDSNNTSDPDEQKVGEKLQLSKPTINQIKDGEKIVAGKAEKAATVDIYKKNAQGGFDKIATDVGVSPDGSYTYNNPDGFKDGDVVKVISKKPGMYDNEETATVGVDKSKLIKAIDDGKDALDPEKGGKNNGTPADEKLKKAIEEGNKVKNDPNATQKDVKEKTKAIEDAIKEKEATDKALDELKKAKEELDKTIKDAEEDEKPDEAIEKGQEASDTAGGVIDKKGKDKDGKDMTAEQIKELVEKTKEENRLLRLPVIQVTIDTAVNNGNTVVFTTNPGRCKVTITILRSDGKKETYEKTTDPGGTGSITIGEALKPTDYILVEATRKTKERPVPDYIDNYTSKTI